MKILHRNGVLRTDRVTLRQENPDWDCGWGGAYEWLGRRMEEKLGGRPNRDTLPIWAWYQWCAKRRRPDLRASGFLPRGTEGVRIEFEIDDARVVLSDFELWHYVLNYWYLPKSEQDEARFEKQLERRRLDNFKQKPLPDPTWHRKIEKSWERIFDLEWHDEFVTGEERSIQATFWELDRSMLRRMTHFTAR